MFDDFLEVRFGSFDFFNIVPLLFNIRGTLPLSIKFDNVVDCPLLLLLLLLLPLLPLLTPTPPTVPVDVTAPEIDGIIPTGLIFRDVT